MEITFLPSAALVGGVIKLEQIVRGNGKGAYVSILASRNPDCFYGATIAEYSEPLNQVEFEAFVRDFVEKRQIFIKRLIREYGEVEL